MIPVHPAGPKLDDRVPHSPLGLLFGVSVHQQALFFRQLATMIDGGLTSGRAIDTLSQHVPGHFGAALRNMVPRLNEGWPLAKCLALYPEYFDELTVCLVQAGETGGQLDLRLKELADLGEESYAVRQALVSQAIYPLVILHAAIFLPSLYLWVTKGGAAYLQATLPRLIMLWGAFFLIYLAMRVVSLAPGLRIAVDSILLYVPLLGKVLRDGALMRALRALGDLLEAGIATGKAVQIASRASGNMGVGARLSRMEKLLDTGYPLSGALAQTGIVPPMVMQMIVTGEHSGTIGGSLNKAAALLKVDFDNAVRRMAAVAPVLLMLVVAGIVGWQVVSFYREYFSQLNSIMP